MTDPQKSLRSHDLRESNLIIELVTKVHKPSEGVFSRESNKLIKY